MSVWRYNLFELVFQSKRSVVKRKNILALRLKTELRFRYSSAELFRASVNKVRTAMMTSDHRYKMAPEEKKKHTYTRICSEKKGQLSNGGN